MITGFENNISLKTEGDFMGLMIMLIKTKIVSINDEREESGNGYILHESGVRSAASKITTYAAIIGDNIALKRFILNYPCF